MIVAFSKFLSQRTQGVETAAVARRSVERDELDSSYDCDASTLDALSPEILSCTASNLPGPDRLALSYTCRCLSRILDITAAEVLRSTHTLSRFEYLEEAEFV